MTFNGGLTNYRQVEEYVDDSDKPLILLKTLKRIVEKLDHINSLILSKNYEKKYLELSKIKQTMEILSDSIDMRYGEISQNLLSLYVYMMRRLDEANNKNNTEIINECKSLIVTLYEGFEAAYEKEKQPGKKQDAHIQRKEKVNNFQGYSNVLSSRAECI